MVGTMTYVGMDVHARSTHAAAVDVMTGELSRMRFGPGIEAPVQWLRSLEGPVRACYEAGPTGFGLYRAASAAGVAVSPCGERENSDSPRAASSASMCRPTVGWVSASFLAAPDRLPSRATSRKVRNSSQPGSLSVIQKCIT